MRAVGALLRLDLHVRQRMRIKGLIRSVVLLQNELLLLVLRLHLLLALRLPCLMRHLHHVHVLRLLLLLLHLLHLLHPLHLLHLL